MKRCWCGRFITDRICGVCGKKMEDFCSNCGYESENVEFCFCKENLMLSEVENIFNRKERIM